MVSPVSRRVTKDSPGQLLLHNGQHLFQSERFRDGANGTPEFARRFGRFALFTWTCNTMEGMRAATKFGARVILTDERT